MHLFSLFRFVFCVPWGLLVLLFCVLKVATWLFCFYFIFVFPSSIYLFCCAYSVVFFHFCFCCRVLFFCKYAGMTARVSVTSPLSRTIILNCALMFQSYLPLNPSSPSSPTHSFHPPIVLDFLKRVVDRQSNVGSFSLSLNRSNFS